LAAGEGLSANIRDMLVQAVREALTQGPGGMIDHYAIGSRGWGFDLADVQCKTRVMIARDDTNVPPAHGYWLVEHLEHGEAVVVGGGHLGPREEAEEDLLGWLAGRTA
jgi:pimeloyl-ACP methyl ester carboxylesterase